MMFVCTTIKLVGVDLVATQVLPLLASGEESTTVESVVEAVPTQAVTTVVTEEVIPAASKDSYSTEASSATETVTTVTIEESIPVIVNESTSIVQNTSVVAPPAVGKLEEAVEETVIPAESVEVVSKSTAIVSDEVEAPPSAETVTGIVETESTSAVVTLRKQIIDPVSNEVTDSKEYNVEIPDYALSPWWQRLITAISSRFSAFNASKFITSIGNSENITDESLRTAIEESGASCSHEQLEDIKAEAGVSEPGVLVRYLVFIRKTVKVVGVELVETQVLPLLASSGGSLVATADTTADASKETSVTATDSVVTAKPKEGWLTGLVRVVKAGAVAAGSTVVHASETAGGIVVKGVGAAGSAISSGATAVSGSVIHGAEYVGSAAVHGALSAGTAVSNVGESIGSTAKAVGGAVVDTGDKVIDVLFGHRSSSDGAEQVPVSAEKSVVEGEVVTTEAVFYVITVTRRVVDPDSGEIKELSEVDIEVPDFAVNCWWSRLVGWITLRNPSFDVSTFLKAVEEAPDCDDATIAAILESNGIQTSSDEWTALKTHVTKGKPDNFLQLFAVLKKAVKLVGVELVIDQVLRVFDAESGDDTNAGPKDATESSTTSTAKSEKSSWFSKVVRTVKTGVTTAVHVGESLGAAGIQTAKTAGTAALHALESAGDVVADGLEAAGTAVVSTAADAGEVISETTSKLLHTSRTPEPSASHVSATDDERAVTSTALAETSEVETATAAPVVTPELVEVTVVETIVTERVQTTDTILQEDKPTADVETPATKSVEVVTTTEAIIEAPSSAQESGKKPGWFSRMTQAVKKGAASVVPGRKTEEPKPRAVESPKTQPSIVKEVTETVTSAVTGLFPVASSENVSRDVPTTSVDEKSVVATREANYLSSRTESVELEADSQFGKEFANVTIEVVSQEETHEETQTQVDVAVTAERSAADEEARIVAEAIAAAQKKAADEEAAKAEAEKIAAGKKAADEARLKDEEARLVREAIAAAEQKAADEAEKAQQASAQAAEEAAAKQTEAELVAAAIAKAQAAEEEKRNIAESTRQEEARIVAEAIAKAASGSAEPAVSEDDAEKKAAAEEARLVAEAIANAGRAQPTATSYTTATRLGSAIERSAIRTTSSRDSFDFKSSPPRESPTAMAAPSMSQTGTFRGRVYEGVRSSSTGSRITTSPSHSPVPAPVVRSAADGPVVPISAVTGVVRATNPILDELLHAIQLLNSDDPSLTSLDIKDCKVLTPNLCGALAAGLATNTHLKDLNLANTKLQTSSAIEIATALRTNNTLETLNLESNAIAPAGIKALAESLESNSRLLELKLSNQKSPAGTDAEQAFARAMQKNNTLVKLGLLIRDVASRNSVDRAITRNKDIARKARLASTSS
ncbi:hypothetical protein DFJ73DRAFT_814132 [Zopfochytrium polystomum]|nr:hypothetical protein DFJ73DRAFT_814132 [Zopfochytrium polystomum]